MTSSMPTERAELVARDPDNAVTVILPEPDGDADRYQAAAQRLAGWVRSGHYIVDDEAALYVYEMSDGSRVDDPWPGRRT